MSDKAKMLVDEVLKWWNEHQYDTHDGDFNTYEEEPDFVLTAMELAEENKPLLDDEDQGG